MTATWGKFDFLALSSLATKYGVGGTVAVRRSLELTGYTSKTSRLSSAAERALQQPDEALSGSASNIENIELQDLSGAVNSALRSTEQAETALDGAQSKALTSINDQPLDTAWVSQAAWELAGLKKAMTEDHYCVHPHGSWDGNLDPFTCADWRWGSVPAPSPSPKPSDKGNLKDLGKKHLQALVRALSNLAGKAAAALPGIIGS